MGLGHTCIDWMRPKQLRPFILIQPCSHQTYDYFVVRFTVGGQMHPDCWRNRQHHERRKAAVGCWTEDIRVVRCYFKYVQNFATRRSHVSSATVLRIPRKPWDIHRIVLRPSNDAHFRRMSCVYRFHYRIKCIIPNGRLILNHFPQWWQTYHINLYFVHNVDFYKGGDVFFKIDENHDASLWRSCSWRTDFVWQNYL